MFSDPSHPKYDLRPKRDTSRKDELLTKLMPYLGLIMIVAALVLFVAVIFAVCPKMESGVWYNSGLFR